MPTDQAGMAGALASTSRQFGAAVGVAVTGSIITAGSGAGFVTSAHSAWVVIASCGALVVLAGRASTSRWAVQARNSMATDSPGPCRSRQSLPTSECQVATPIVGCASSGGARGRPIMSRGLSVWGCGRARMGTIVRFVGARKNCSDMLMG